VKKHSKPHGPTFYASASSWPLLGGRLVDLSKRAINNPHVRRGLRQVARLISEYSLERPRPPSRERLDRAQQTRERLDKMLRAYWSFLIVESEPIAEALLDPASISRAKGMLLFECST
jgi:hypothetical protein